MCFRYVLGGELGVKGLLSGDLSAGLFPSRVWNHGGLVGLMERIRERSGAVVYIPEVDDSDREDPRFLALLEWAGDVIVGKDVADVGCWVGHFVEWAAARGARRTCGIDVGGPWIDAARRRASGSCILEVSSLSELESRLNGSWDTIVCLETLEHVERRTEAVAIRAMARVLSSGGQLIVATPAASLSALFDPAWSLMGHRHYRAATLRDMFRDAGLDVISVGYSGTFWNSLDTLLMYFIKYVRRRGYRGNRWITPRSSSRIRPRYRCGATSVWIRGKLRE